MAPRVPIHLQDGVRFSCQCSSRCCRFRDGHAHVYVSLEERRRLAEHLGMTTSAFTRTWCETEDGEVQLRSEGEACVFLRDGLCSVYEARPVQCRTWPFWPENMSRAGWNEVAAFCPGVGKGRLIPATEIARTLKRQHDADAKRD